MIERSKEELVLLLNNRAIYNIVKQSLLDNPVINPIIIDNGKCPVRAVIQSVEDSLHIGRLEDILNGSCGFEHERYQIEAIEKGRLV